MITTVQTDEIKRLKGMGFLQQKGTDCFNARVITGNGKLAAAQARRIIGKIRQRRNRHDDPPDHRGAGHPL